MVAGHLTEKKGYYYAVLNYKDYTGKRKSKWVSTGLPVKGNKRRAEKILADIKRDFVPEEPKRIEANMLFSDYMESWLNIIKGSVAVPTYSSYSEIVNKNIIPYFRERKITLQGLTAKDIQAFYFHELQRVSASTVIHYHANIHKALKYAVKIDLIEVNPADKVERPKRKQYVGSFYDADEINALFEAAKGTKLELPILFGAFYGLPAEGRVFIQETNCVLGNFFLGSASDWKSKINRYVCGTACLFCNTGMAVFLGKMHALKV